MSTEAVFLQDICASPDDDVPRLVYADWLDDRAGPDDAARAEFIRVQCRLAQLETNDPARRPLQRRERELLGPRLVRWWGEVPVWARLESVLGPERSFRRGFVYAVTGSVASFLSDGAALLQSFPVQRLHLNEAGNFLVRALAEGPLLAGIKWLGLSGPFGVEAVRALVSSAHLRRLIALDLQRNFLGDDAVVALAQASALPGLRELFLDQSNITDEGAEALAASACLSGLTFLTLANNAISDAGGRALATSPHLQNLAFLDLTGNPIIAGVGQVLRQRFGTAVLLPN